jgi:chloride channel 3/4/5
VCTFLQYSQPPSEFANLFCYLGVLIGVNAALISILAEWLSDIKMGYCKDKWWLNQEFCCWENMTDEELGCSSWVPWSRFAIVQWFIYVLCAVSIALLSLIPR